jgi:glycine cleavage system aminomethyltransferase T/glycine/D-amino acid oxidase-like deaminating enzyme|tara:strand:- start:3041 stop:5488 length:2448 start_codon:yes stop_codon:yes gene_type:complete
MAKNVPERAQVVIIGGGIVGASIAYHLTELGWTDVVLLERHTLTSGTTWHAAGLVGQLRATHNMTRLAAYSADLYHRLEHDMDHPTGFKKVGSLSVADNHERLEELVRGAGMARCFDVDIEVIEADELVERWPLINPDGILGGVWIPSDGQASPVDTTMALAAVAKKNGAKIVEGISVESIRTSDGRAIGVDTDNGPIDAEYVVTAAGMWSHQLGRDVGVNIPLHACEHFYLVTEPVPDLPSGLPVLRDTDNCIYVKEDAGRLLVGAFEPIAKPFGAKGLPHDRPFMQLDEDWDHLAPVYERACERIPILNEIGIRLFFNGPEAFTPDDRYLLGPTPELDNHFVAAGFNSVGIQSAGGAGKVLAEWIVDGRPPMDLWDVDIRRAQPFQTNRRYLHDRSVESLGLLYAMHWPFRQVETARGVRRSPFHDRLINLGACHGENGGWERPNWFAPEGVEPKYEYTYGRQNWFEHSAAEHRACRENAALFDQTSLAKILVQGPDAAAVLNKISSANVDVQPGTSVYTTWLNDRGGIEADLTVNRLDEERFLVVTAYTTQLKDSDWIIRNVPDGSRVAVTDVTSAWATLGIFGPKARDFVSPITDADLSNEAFPFGTLQEIDFGYARAIAVRRTYMGELGWEIYLPTEFAVGAFDQLWESGQPNGLELAGMHAMNSLRMEKAYRHWGDDICDEDTPLEAGLSWGVAWDKPGGFIGRDALLSQRETGITRRLVQFRIDDPKPLLYHNEPVYKDGTIVGRITSGMYGHTVGAALGMGYVSHEVDVPRDQVIEGSFEVEINGKRFPATASFRPFYDPESKQVHL